MLSSGNLLAETKPGDTVTDTFTKWHTLAPDVACSMLKPSEILGNEKIVKSEK